MASHSKVHSAFKAATCRATCTQAEMTATADCAPYLGAHVGADGRAHVQLAVLVLVHRGLVQTLHAEASDWPVS